MFKNPVLWIVIVLVGMLSFVFWPNESGPQQRRMGGEALVEVAVVKSTPFDDEISALGSTQANESIELKADNTDRIHAIHFDDGDIVVKNQRLVTMKHDEELASIADLEATLKEHRRQLERLRDLEKQSATAASAIEKQVSLIDSTEAKRQIAQVRLNKKFIKAPFSGQLGLRQVSPGQLVTSNAVFTTLDDLSKIKVEFQLSEKYLNKISKGQKVTAKHVAFDMPFEGQIDSISSRVDTTSRAFTVRALFPNPKNTDQQFKLRPGMLLQLKITLTASNALVIPESAIVPVNNEHFVFVLQNDNTVLRKSVEVGRRKPGFVEIISGLSEGDKVVYKGVLKVRNGAKVAVAKEGA